MKKAIVNQDVCIGCGACQAIAPSNFEISDEGTAKAIANPIPEEFIEDVQDAAEGCPTGAIEITEEKED